MERNKIRQKRKHPIQDSEWKKSNTITPPKTNQLGNQLKHLLRVYKWIYLRFINIRIKRQEN